MSSKRTVDNHYLSLLLPAFRKHSEHIAFRSYLGDNAWSAVTYRQLESYLAVAQAHWKNTLEPLNLKPLDVVAFWLTGRKLSDLVNSIAVSSLGYTPQFFSGYFSSVSVVSGLLSKSGGKAIIIDPSFATEVSTGTAISVPHFAPLESDDLDRLVFDGTNIAVFAPVAAVGVDDLGALFHSSGTTGALPKIIPNTFKMLRAVITGKFVNAQIPLEGGGQTVVNTLGSLAHIGSFHCFLGAVYLGQCVTQTSGMVISPEELIGLTSICKMTILVMYAPFLSTLIKAAQQDPAVKDALKSINQVVHTGVALNKEDEEWAYANGVRIMTSYGTTETGPMLMSRLGSDASSRLLRPLKGTTSVFIPYSDQEKGAGGLQLYELVVPSSADDSPPSEFCSDDGYYHTNDLFEKSEDGWIYRGRAGDWIKLLGGFCDTKTIEDAVRALGAGLIHDAVVVGDGRNLAGLVVEAAEGPLDEAKRQELAQEIVKRATEFNRGLFPHERIEDPERIIVVEKGSLPRTKEKGNIRRAATEAMFAETLDRVCA
ncbi:hypothetical protein VTO73DRAFT_15474 [Trametes versicolor]